MAADQIEILLPELRVNEGSAISAAVNFRTRATAAATTPTTIRYRLDCVSTGAEILNWTDVSPASAVTIAITGAQNVIQNDANDYEIKQMTVTADDLLSTQQREIARWRVVNLFGSP